MIVQILSGGIGNQMFEYAAARAMALRNSTQLVLNTRIGFERDKLYHRVYCLDSFNIKYIKRRIISFDIPFGSILDRFSRKLGFHILCPWYRYLHQDDLKVEDILKPLKNKNVILAGGWINPVYFDDCSSTIRKDFTPAIDFPSTVSDYVDRIRTSAVPVVAMGVRVYQEVKNEKTREERYFQTKGDFYNNALQHLKSRIGSFKLLIFTQVEDWVRKNVNLDDIDYEFVNASTGDADAINDMYIMSCCHHFIISNSTYYYWGCWMSRNTDKIIVVPRRWEKCPIDNPVKL